jgi:hypothetical protein
MIIFTQYLQYPPFYISKSRYKALLNLGLRVNFPGRRPRPPAKQGSYSSVSENSVTFLTGGFYLKNQSGKILSQCPFEIWLCLNTSSKYFANRYMQTSYIRKKAPYVYPKYLIRRDQANWTKFSHFLEREAKYDQSDLGPGNQNQIQIIAHHTVEENVASWGWRERDEEMEGFDSMYMWYLIKLAYLPAIPIWNGNAIEQK